MVEKKREFDKGKRNIEIEIVRNNIELLKKYKVAKTDEEKNQIMSQMDVYCAGLVRGIIKKNKFTIDEYIARLEKAIELDSYRPRNLSVFEFAMSRDLYNVGGEFDTFAIGLARAEKEGDVEAVRDMYNGLTVNRFVLAKQFAYDWIRRLNNNPELVKKARNAKPDEEIDAYNELFSKLAKDFCDDCNLPKNSFVVKVVKNWESSDVKPSDRTACGFCTDSYALDFPDGIGEEEKKKMKQEFLKSPKDYPGARKVSLIRVSFENVKNLYKGEDEFFYGMMDYFAHEMHHGLDSLAPSLGAVGPQVMRSDRKIYVSSEKDYDKYRKSATEWSSYEIGYELFNQLKNQNY